MEQPLPWPADVGASACLQGVAELCAGAKFRLQALVPLYDDGERRLICYRRGEPGWASPLVRSELAVAGDDLLDAARALLSGGGPAPEDGHQEVLDLLVCTHGSRDTCCGSAGTSLFLNLSARERDLGASTRLWRTSHTGGHRFAPTALLLPEATLWAYVDEQLVEALAGGGPWQAAFWDRYRGCAVIGGAKAQALEAAVATRVGRRLLEDRRRADLAVPAVGADSSRARLATRHFGVWEADVRPGRRVPQPDCRADPELAHKFSTEWVVEDLARI